MMSSMESDISKASTKIPVPNRRSDLSSCGSQSSIASEKLSGPKPTSCLKKKRVTKTPKKSEGAVGEERTGGARKNLAVKFSWQNSLRGSGIVMDEVKEKKLSSPRKPEKPPSKEVDVKDRKTPRKLQTEVKDKKTPRKPLVAINSKPNAKTVTELRRSEKTRKGVKTQLEARVADLQASLAHVQLDLEAAHEKGYEQQRELEEHGSTCCQERQHLTRQLSKYETALVERKIDPISFGSLDCEVSSEDKDSARARVAAAQKALMEFSATADSLSDELEKTVEDAERFCDASSASHSSSTSSDPPSASDT